ncbi:MAG: uncharacterized protein QOE84_1419 [Actinomycetota bacterium]|nr:uncharacterized protein [Actinomycetota bacterium]
MSDLLDDAWLRPATALLRLRRAECVLLIAVPFLVAAVLTGIVAGVSEAVAVACLGLAATSLALVSVDRRWRAWGYAERDDDLLVRRGVLVRRTSVVPYGRMQYVDVTAGPLDRRLGIARVTMHTAAAASDASIPGLPVEEANRLRDRLAALGEARQAGV